MPNEYDFTIREDDPLYTPAEREEENFRNAVEAAVKADRQQQNAGIYSNSSVVSWRKAGEYFVSVNNPFPGCLPPGTYHPNYNTSTSEFWYNPIASTSDKLFTLPDMPMDFIVNQMRDFWTKTEEYNKYGFTQKRGILLYGSPGGGKSSIVNLLRDEVIKQNGVIFLLPEEGFGTLSRAVRHFRSVEPNRPVMTLVEDLETYLEGSNGSNTAAQEKAALALYDGEMQINNVVHVATTNKPELIADRFIRRPGRFDLIVGVHAPSPACRRAYLENIGNNQITKEQIDEIVSKTDGLSLAYMREIASTYLVLGMPLSETIARLRTQAKAKYGNKTGFTIGFKDEEN